MNETFELLKSASISSSEMQADFTSSRRCQAFMSQEAYFNPGIFRAHAIQSPAVLHSNLSGLSVSQSPKT